MMAIHFALFLLILAFSPSVVTSATFENVTVLLTSQFSSLLVTSRPSVTEVFIQSSYTVGEYVNLQPLEVVTIRDAKIPILKENSLSNLHNIQHIAVISSGIKEIEAGVLNNVPKLAGVNFNNNSITEIKNEVFTGLHIKYLYLSDNKISRIEAEAFNNMTLTFINLNSNRLSQWNGDWFVGTPVGSIYMSDNLLEEIPENAFNYVLQFKRINAPLIMWHLVLTKNRIRRVDKDAFRHINGFGTFSLSNNRLRTLPKEVFASVKNANYMHLSNNQIDNIDGVFDDINIHQLILINNSLSCFPVQAFDVSILNYVFLDGNRFTCECVHMWNKIQLHNGVLALYNMKLLEDDCIEKI